MGWQEMYLRRGAVVLPANFAGGRHETSLSAAFFTNFLANPTAPKRSVQETDKNEASNKTAGSKNGEYKHGIKQPAPHTPIIFP